MAPLCAGDPPHLTLYYTQPTSDSQHPITLGPSTYTSVLPCRRTSLRPSRPYNQTRLATYARARDLCLSVVPRRKVRALHHIPPGIMAPTTISVLRHSVIDRHSSSTQSVTLKEGKAERRTCAGKGEMDDRSRRKLTEGRIARLVVVPPLGPDVVFGRRMKLCQQVLVRLKLVGEYPFARDYELAGPCCLCVLVPVLTRYTARRGRRCPSSHSSLPVSALRSPLSTSLLTSTSLGSHVSTCRPAEATSSHRHPDSVSK
jgi:hypothetical protein